MSATSTGSGSRAPSASARLATANTAWATSSPRCLPIRRDSHSQAGVASSAGARNAAMSTVVSFVRPSSYSAK